MWKRNTKDPYKKRYRNGKFCWWAKAYRRAAWVAVEGHTKENPRCPYAVGFQTEPALVVRGSSRRITIMRFRPANIRVINRRDSFLDRDPCCPWVQKKEKTVLVIDWSFHIRGTACRALRSPIRYESARQATGAHLRFWSRLVHDAASRRVGRARHAVPHRPNESGGKSS